MLICDTIHHTETNHLPGSLIQIDFAKAFDSLSWKFVYKIMDFLASMKIYSPR